MMTATPLMDDGGEGNDASLKGAWSRRESLFAGALIVIGLALRLARYLAHNSLWHDESTLSLNLVSRSFAGLLTPLDYGQAAPVGFLMLEKLSVACLGSSEYALRLVPQLAGLLSVPLFFLVARKVLACRAALVALAIFASSESLIQYSAEVKQYSLDVAMALLMFWLALDLLQSAPEARRSGRLLWLGAIGAVAVWLSHPALFVLGGVGICLAIQSIRAGRGVAALAVVGLIWAVSFLVNFWFFTRTLSHDAGMLSYWSGDFAPMPPRSLAQVTWYGTTMFRTFKDVWGNPAVLPDLGHILSGLGLLMGITGAWFLWTTRRSLLVLLILPMALTLVASALHKYPFRGRLVLFNLPVVILLMSAGVEAIGAWCSRGQAGERRGCPLHCLCVILLAGVTLGVAGVQAMRTSEHQATRQALEALQGRMQSGDVVYLYPGFNPPFTFYTRYRAGLAVATDVMPGHPDQWPTFAADLAQVEKVLEGGRAVWVVVSIPTNEPDDRGREALLKRLESIGAVKPIFQGAGSGVYRVATKL